MTELTELLPLSVIRMTSDEIVCVAMALQTLGLQRTLVERTEPVLSLQALRLLDALEAEQRTRGDEFREPPITIAARS